MWNEPTEHELRQLPSLGSTDEIPLEEKMLYMYFQIRKSHWYAAEYDPIQRVFFGYWDLGERLFVEKWRRFAYDPLREMRDGQIEVERDTRWQPKPFRELAREMDWYEADGTGN